MSKITDLAEAEAARVEAELGSEDEENGEEEAEAETEEEQQPEPEQPGTPAEATAALPFDEKALERELNRHERAMAKVLGDGWSDMKPCDSCAGAGYLPAEYTPEPEVLLDPECIVCDACNGYGSRITGSRAPGSETITCSVCNGAGWRDRKQIEAMRQLASVPAPAAAPPTPPPMPIWNPVTNQWELANGQPHDFSTPPAPPFAVQA